MARSRFLHKPDHRPDGGYHCGFGPATGFATVNGTMTISGSSTFVVSNVVVF